MWAHEHSGHARHIGDGQGIGSGLLLAVSTTAAIAGRTLPGTPVARTPVTRRVRRRVATLDVLAEERLVENAAARGDQLLDGCARCRRATPT